MFPSLASQWKRTYRGERRPTLAANVTASKHPTRFSIFFPGTHFIPFPPLIAAQPPQILWKFTLTFELLHFGQLPDALFSCKRPTEWRDKAVRLKEQLRRKRGTWFTRDNVTWRWERPSTWQQSCNWRKWLIICRRLWEFNLLCGS